MLWMQDAQEQRARHTLEKKIPSPYEGEGQGGGGNYQQSGYSTPTFVLPLSGGEFNRNFPMLFHLFHTSQIRPCLYLIQQIHIHNPQTK